VQTLNHKLRALDMLDSIQRIVHIYLTYRATLVPL